jgi:Kef-type K+ transport system membrane component KefB
VLWYECALVIAVAVGGKFGGASIAAYLSTMLWREAAALGILMNTRGLVELVVLNIGSDFGVIPSSLFTRRSFQSSCNTLVRGCSRPSTTVSTARATSRSWSEATSTWLKTRPTS